MQGPNSPYDLAVAYRIYPKVAAVALPLPSGDHKYRLAEICLKSFKDSLNGLHVRIWAILDGCPPEYADLFTKYFDAKDLTLLRLNGVGNQATFHRQIEILLNQQDSDVVYFAEDDYFYLPGQFRCMIGFLSEHKDADFVSPYDHLDYYTMDLHREPKSVRVHSGKHWMTASSTCLTFLTSRDTLQKTKVAFHNYKRRSLDCSLWLSLTKHRVFNPLFFIRHLVRERISSRIVLKSWLYCWRQILFGKSWKLWVPIKAVATHLDVNALSPNVDWQTLLEEANRQSPREFQSQNALEATIRQSVGERE
jgi:hypothetical protein